MACFPRLDAQDWFDERRERAPRFRHARCSDSDLYYSAAHPLFSNALVAVQRPRDPSRQSGFVSQAGCQADSFAYFITRKAVLAAMGPKRYKYGKRKVSMSQLEFARKRSAAETTDGEVSGEVE